MKDNVIVRNARVADSEAIARIHVNTWKSAYKGQLPDALLDTLSVEERKKGWENIISERTEKEYVLVAEHEGEVLGWCSGGFSRDENADSSTGELYGIYVKHDSLGRGIGTLLMNAMKDRLKKDGYARITLWTLGTNTSSHDFYVRCGWNKSEVYKNEERNGFVLHEVQFVYLF